jgi:hypothetical protein
VQILRQLPDRVDDVMRHADAILTHRFPMSDAGWWPPYNVQLPAAFSWYTPPAGSDPEFVHGLNRHRYWVTLAMAYRFTNDRRYADELIGQIVSWSEQSPRLEHHADWRKTTPRWHLLDAAIRADTWPWVLHLMLDSEAWTPEINTLFLHRLWMHAELVDPEIPDKLGNNWVIMMAQGVLNIAMLFPEFRQSAAWEKHAAFHLERCMNQQFYDDGGHDEQSPGYHEGCIVWILEPLYLAKLNGRDWPRPMWAKMRGVCECLFQLLHPDGEFPALSDSGRGKSLALLEAAQILEEPQWAKFNPRPNVREAWLLGRTNVASSESLQPRPAAVAFPKVGYYVMRSGDDPRARQMVFDCGPHGNWHGHFDLLGFEHFGVGRVLITDPGVPIYADTPERAWQRGAAAHNTISIDGQDYIPMEGPDHPGLKVTAWEVAEDHVLVAGYHRGYESLTGAPLVGRCVWYDRADTFVIVDWGHATSPHDYTVSFTFPTTNVSDLRSGAIRTLHGGGDVLVQSLPTPGQGEVRMIREERPWTVLYGVQKPGIRFATTRHANEAVFVTIVRTYESDDAPPLDATVDLSGPRLDVSLNHKGARTRVRLNRPF